MTQLIALQTDITQLPADIIVNAANCSLLGGGGVDGAIHRAAGPQLLQACRTLGGCRTGEAKITLGFNLPAKFIIHTPGPAWHGGTRKEPELLACCYTNALELALKYRGKTVAFPCISTGVYGFPHGLAAQTALSAVRQFLLAHPNAFEKIYFACFLETDLTIYQKLLQEPLC